MRKAKVLVVDDAMLIRRMVTDVLAADPSIEVVGEAANGRIALQKIAQLSPDLVTLDIEMPEMDGIQTLKEIRKAYPRLSVIMFSALTERGAADTLEALHHGASDYVTKPASAAGKATAQQRILEDLVPKIKSGCRSWLRCRDWIPARVSKICRKVSPARSPRCAAITASARRRASVRASRGRDADHGRRRGHRGLDGRTGRACRSALAPARRFPRADSARAAHAADVHAVSR